MEQKSNNRVTEIVPLLLSSPNEIHFRLFYGKKETENEVWAKRNKKSQAGSVYGWARGYSGHGPWACHNVQSLSTASRI